MVVDISNDDVIAENCRFGNWMCVPTRLLNSTQWLKRQRMKLVAEKVLRCALQCFFPLEIHKYTNTQIRKYTNTQVLKNEPYKDVPLLNGKFTEGQYTHKIYHLASKVVIVVFIIIILWPSAWPSSCSSPSSLWSAVLTNLSGQVPSWIKMVAPTGSLEVIIISILVFFLIIFFVILFLIFFVIFFVIFFIIILNLFLIISLADFIVVNVVISTS